MQIPAFCDTCGTAFRSGIEISNSWNVTLSGCTSGPCPVCGGVGHVPDGVFNVFGNTIEILSAPTRTVEELCRLEEILRRARAKKQEPSDVAEAIRAELPQLSGIADLLPKTRSELYGFIALILAAISLLNDTGDKATTITINQTFNQMFLESDRKATERKSEREDRRPLDSERLRKIGRNEPCICGSGKKYKKCCGASP